MVCAWDPVAKKRIKAYPKHKSSISSMAFNKDGTLLAVASSYCYEEGEKEYSSYLMDIVLKPYLSFVVTRQIRSLYGLWKRANLEANRHKFMLRWNFFL